MPKNDDSILGIPQPDPRKKTRKTKKQLEKELLIDYNNEKQQNDESMLNKSYNMMQYLSAREKKTFEEKFTKPKNGIQRDYHNLLNQKSKKIVVATGPAGTGKTMFATETAVKYFLMGTYEKLIFTRPYVSVD